MKLLRVKLDNQVMNLWVEKIGDTLWLHRLGRTWTYKAETKRKNLSSTSSQSGNIVAPMPGKILKISVKVGDRVERGQKIIAMEAMKMEYSLESEIAGTVVEVSCAVGDQVVLGKQLAQIKAK